MERKAPRSIRELERVEEVATDLASGLVCARHPPPGARRELLRDQAELDPAGDGQLPLEAFVAPGELAPELRHLRERGSQIGRLRIGLRTNRAPPARRRGP
jgi:DNA-binding IclR family transcriptional regulator